MAKQLKAFPAQIKHDHADPVGVSMPRRARILHVRRTSARSMSLFAEVEIVERLGSQAPDPIRHFLFLGDGDHVPEDGSFVGADESVLVYEVRG